MIRLLILIMVAPLTVTAQEATVRTAEHDGFTRIAIDYSTVPEWAIDLSDMKLVLTTDRPITYNLSDVFRRIERDRVVDFSQSAADSLTIDLGCNCKFETFHFPNGGLAIDISTALTDIPPTGEDLTPGISEDGTEQAFESQAGSIGPSMPLLPGMLTRGTSDPPLSEDHEDRVAALRYRLADELAETSGGTDESSVDMRSDLAAQYRAEETVTRDQRGYSSVPPKIVCPPYAKDDLRDWMTARRRIPSTDKDVDWMTAEAQRMIANGMGIEAARLLEAYPDPGSDRRILTELAHLMDGQVEAPLVAQAADCGPLLSLMALTADPPVLPNRVATIIAALQGAPDSVRPFLEGRAMSSLLALGREEDALILALLHKSSDGRTAPFPGRIYPTVSVTGMPSAV